MRSGTSTPSTILPFRINVSPIRLESIRERVRTFRWDAWSEPADANDWRYDPPATYMRKLCEYWVDHYDWRLHEQAMNARKRFVTTLDQIDIHFTHERGSGPSPTPLLIAHGWPYSFHSHDGLIEQLAHPERYGAGAEEALSVLVPS